VNPGGDVVSAEEWKASRGAWLPTSDDQAYIESLMKSHFEPGRFGPWIAPPTKGIDQKTTDFEYVKAP
jgi:benzoyl-CoA 2,3-dioxygenase component B